MINAGIAEAAPILPNISAASRRVVDFESCKDWTATLMANGSVLIAAKADSWALKTSTRPARKAAMSASPYAGRIRQMTTPHINANNPHIKKI